MFWGKTDQSIISLDNEDDWHFGNETQNSLYFGKKKVTSNMKT